VEKVGVSGEARVEVEPDLEGDVQPDSDSQAAYRDSYSLSHRIKYLC